MRAKFMPCGYLARPKIPLKKGERMLFGEVKRSISIEGVMPERALLRLKRAGNPVFNVKKTEKTRILLQVKKKDCEKVFAIYPNVCYNSNVYSPYVVQDLGATGVFGVLEGLKMRIGLWLGALAFVIVSLWLNTFVFAVDVIGAQSYTRDALLALERGGIRTLAPYSAENTDLICAELLALDGVEYCSVKKVGMRVRVEIRTAKFEKPTFSDGAMQAKHTGELVALTVLRGTALKKIGDKVTAGETLVQDGFETEDGGQVRVQVIARVRIACSYEGVHAAESAEEAFAQAYLELSLGPRDEITEKAITQTQDGFHVKIAYTAIETWNF